MKLHIKLAAKHGLGLIIHNRVATKDIISLLKNDWSPSLSGKTVFHCCPPEKELLIFAEKRNIFIGIDGDITYDGTKTEFIKRVPLKLLVLETDSPYLTPQPLRKSNRFPNTPENLIYVAKKVAEIKDISEKVVIETTTNNAKHLFDII